MNKIYLLNSKSLMQSLLENKITDFTAVKYLIISTVLMGQTFSFNLAIEAESTPLIFDIIYFIAFISLNYYGLIWLFQINLKNDGSDFFKRFICLSLPITIQIMIPLTIIMIAFGASDILAGSFLYIAIDIIGLLSNLIFYILMGNELRQTKQHTKQHT